jgi:hypothetical protein
MRPIAEQASDVSVVWGHDRDRGAPPQRPVRASIRINGPSAAVRCLRRRRN